MCRQLPANWEKLSESTTGVHVRTAPQGDRNPEVFFQPSNPEGGGGDPQPHLVGESLPGITPFPAAPGWLSESSLHAGEAAV